MPTVILDTDFFSSFLKIERCELIRSFYQVKQAMIPTAVYRELAQTDLLTRLLPIRWITVLPVEPSSDESLLQNPTLQVLGAGEQACIFLAHNLPNAVLLMNDNKARQFARSLGINVVNIPAFLMACMMSGLIKPEQMLQIVHDLKNEDFYEFKANIRSLLLQ
jgi:predicted nucleic acid-binding protein